MKRERRAIRITADGQKCCLLEANGKLATAEREAKAQIVLANASAEAIRMISDNIQDKELPCKVLLKGCWGMYLRNRKFRKRYAIIALPGNNNLSILYCSNKIDFCLMHILLPSPTQGYGVLD